MNLIPFLGQSFGQSYMYAGLGPTTVQTKTYINNITGFENIAPIPTTPTGLGLGEKYSTTQWLYGGIAMVGATYFVDSSWFLDISYSYSFTGKTNSSWGGAWSDTDINNNFVKRTGTNTGTTSGSVNTQALLISINKTFMF